MESSVPLTEDDTRGSHRALSFILLMFWGLNSHPMEGRVQLRRHLSGYKLHTWLLNTDNHFTSAQAPDR